MAHFCSKCGTQLEEGAKFCPKCGTPTEPEEIKQEQQQHFSEQQSAEREIQQGSFVDEVKAKYFCFEGRLNRKPYFLRLLILGIIAGILMMIFKGAAAESTILSLVCGVIYAVALVGQLSLSIRRAHDLNRTGWIVLLSFIPIINIFFALYLLFFRGTMGSNKYGDDPLEN